MARFQIDDFKTICEFIQNNPLGILISNTSSLESLATHIPFQLEDCDDEIIVYGHISKHNRHSEQINDGKQATIIFQGPNAYVSSSLYESVNVPTWNYQAVHLYGNIEFLNDEQLNYHLRSLVENHESKRANPLDYDSIPKEMIEEYKKEIIAFRLIAYKSEAIFKLSQNRNDRDFKAIVEDLEKHPTGHTVAREMRKLRKL